MELSEVESSGADTTELQRQIDELNDRTTDTSTDTDRQGIRQELRNTDHKHSVNTWWETAPSGGDKDKECANIYAYPKIDPITITDAAINTGTPNLSAVISNPFTAAMVGRYVQVAGAGPAGATLITTILAYVDAGHVTLATNAGTTVPAATARINLQKLTHTNKLNAAATNPSDALKDAAHSAFGSNIQDPDWKQDRGIVRIGGTNVAGYPFGRFDSTGLVYAALHLLESGREPFARVNIARTNPYVFFKGKLFLGIYNNHESSLDWVKGTAFDLTPSLDPNPPVSTVSTTYVVVIETDQGYTLVSNPLVVANAPDDAAFAAGNRLTLTWTYFAGATITRVYRKRGVGNVFMMEQLESGTNTWTDVNISTREDTLSGVFPSFGDQVNAVSSYWATSDGALDDLSVDGALNEWWQPLEVTLPFPPSVNMANVFDPHFIIGLTEALATKLTDVQTHSTNVVDSPAAQFTAAMTGKAFTLVKQDGTVTVTGTFTFVSPTQGTLSTPATWTEDGSTLIIDDSQPHGLLFDLVGVSPNPGEWAPHTEDDSELRGQPVASNPNGSTQGSSSGNPPTGVPGTDVGGGRGRIDCVLFDAIGRVFSGNLKCPGRKRADEITLEDLLWNGLGYAADDYNEIESITISYVDELCLFETESKVLPCTHTHRVVSTPGTYRCGKAVGNYRASQNVLISDESSRRIEAVSAIPRITGKFKVVSFKLKDKGRLKDHLMVFNDVVSHNSKLEQNLDQFSS